MPNISTVAARDKLKARHDPYFMKLSTGHFLGFQKLTPTSTGSWILRVRDAGTGLQTKRSLGDFSELVPSERFDAARRQADGFFDHVDHGGSPEEIPVGKACSLYTQVVRDRRGDKAADDLEGRFRRWVTGSSLDKMELMKVRKAHILAWRTSLSKTVVTISRDGRESPPTRPRSPSSVNRDISALRAALNWAKSEGYVLSDVEWSGPLKAAANADGRRTTYLDLHQRRTLVKHCDSEVAGFLRGLSVLPLRPGALAALDVANFDAALGVLNVGKDKAGQDRNIPLPKATAKFFAGLQGKRGPNTPLLARANGTRWTKDAWKGPIKEAVIAAGLPPATTAYSLRHSTITDLVTSGLDLFTVAKLSGTSIAMIEKHYGHLQAHRAVAALETLVL
jgi:integrase